MKILAVGKNSLVARSFISLHKDSYQITAIGKEDNIENLADEYDSVIFFAQSGNYKAQHFTEDLFEVNIRLLYRTLNLVKTKQFIYFSTGSVYARSDSGIYSDSSPIDTQTANPYIASKISGEQLVSTFAFSIPSIVILRPFFIYGQGQKKQMLFSTMHDKIVNGETIQLKGNKGLVFNPIYAEDVAARLDMLIATQPQGINRLNVAGKEIVSLKDVTDIIAKQLDKNPIYKIEDGQPSIMIGEINIPGWEPTITLEQGIAKAFFDEQ